MPDNVSIIKKDSEIQTKTKKSVNVDVFLVVLSLFLC